MAERLTARLEWKITAKLEYVLADMWIGGYWRRSAGQLDVWICLVPCVPLHLVWTRDGCGARGCTHD